MEENVKEYCHYEPENLTVCVEPIDIMQNYEEPKDEEDIIEYVAVKNEVQDAHKSDENENSRYVAECNGENSSHGMDHLQQRSREALLKRVREHQRQRIMKETTEQRQQRLQRVREYQRRRLQEETKEQREARIQKVRENQRRKRLTETEEERAKRLQKVRENQRKRISEETPEQRQIRLQKVREAQRLRRLNETEEQRIQRIRRIIEYQQRRAKQHGHGCYQEKSELESGLVLSEEAEQCKITSDKQYLNISYARGISAKPYTQLEAHTMFSSIKEALLANRT